MAFEVPDRPTLAAFYRKLKGDGVPVHPVDHRISWALYFNDPDGNGLEVYWDARQDENGRQTWKGVDRPLGEAQLNEQSVSAEQRGQARQPVRVCTLSGGQAALECRCS